MAFSFPTISSAKHRFRPTIRKLSDRFRNTIFHKRLTVLSVSLLNGRFKAMSIINDSIHESWEMPGYILRYEALRQAISDAIHHTQFPGTHISILVEDQRFITLTLQLPVMALADLLLFLNAKRNRQKPGKGQQPGVITSAYKLGANKASTSRFGHKVLSMTLFRFVRIWAYIFNSLPRSQHFQKVNSAPYRWNLVRPAFLSAC